MTADQCRATLIEILESADFEFVEAGCGGIFFGYWIELREAFGDTHVITSADQWRALHEREAVPA